MQEINDPLQILVVDDTAIYRKIISDALADIPGVEVVGTAYNGQDALRKILIFQPDLLTLDLEMPKMDGLEVLRQINAMSLDLGSIIISTHTVEGGEMTIRALSRGAFDVILKPEMHTPEQSRELIREHLAFILKGYRESLRKKREHLNRRLTTSAGFKVDSLKLLQPDISLFGRSEIVAIGVSTGGPNALAEVLPKLPADLDVPVLIAQHMPAGFTASLARSLNNKCALEVKEASHMDLLSPGTVFIAPGGHHMKIGSGPVGIRHICITDEDTGSVYRPSIDLLFRSVAEQYGANATGVIMTGMGSDGLQGLKKMKRRGATIITQDEDSCVIYGMPAIVVDAGIADMVVPLTGLADAITHTLRSVNKAAT